MNFAMTGVAGYIAPRHLKSIKETGNTLVAALDIHDSVGILDQHFPNTHFFTEPERFDRHLDKLRRLGEEKKVHYLTVCSPNYLHDAHIRMALRVGAHAICEKPLVLNPWNLDALQEIEEETGKRVYTVLQLRLHPTIVALKKKYSQLTTSNEKYDIELTYITSRGNWYLNSWKGDIKKSGGLASNIGIHFFDMLMWLFGKPIEHEIHISDENKIAGYMELEHATIKWFLSIDKNDLPKEAKEQGKPTFRSMTINEESVEFSDGFTDLHTKVYEDILSGGGFGIDDARPSIEVVHAIRNAKTNATSQNIHPFVKNNA